MTERRCRTCGIDKPDSDFWPNSHGGLQTECKPCMRLRNNEWMRAHAAERRVSNGEATRKNRRLKYEQFALRSARWRAKKAGLEFSLTLADIVIPEFCPVLGIRLVRNTGWERERKKGWKEFSPSIDRIDNAKGYTPDNIIIVSYRANRLKSDASLAELRRLTDFYERLNRDRTESNEQRGLQSKGILWQQDVSLSPMQPQPEKEVDQVLVGQSGA